MENLQPKVAVVILNYNTKPLLERFLPSVTATEYANKEIWVVDNASKDGSAQFVYDNFEDVKVLETKANLGYAGGYNWALKRIDADYYVLLNSDVDVNPKWLNPLVELAISNNKIGAIQPKILDAKDKSMFEYAGASGGFLDKWGYPFCRGRIFDHLEKDNGQYNEKKQIFWATGACMFVSSEAYTNAGGLDVDFFAHMEEIDLCWRMQRMGYEIWVNPESEVFHVGGGTLAEGSSKKYFLNFKNNLILIVKNEQGNFWFVKLIWRMILDGASYFKFLFAGNSQVASAILKAHFAFWKDFRSAIGKRKNIKLLGSTQVKLFNKSIVWHHFAKKVTKFSQL